MCSVELHDVTPETVPLIVFFFLLVFAHDR